MDVSEAVKCVPSGATVTICASSGLLVPDKVLETLGDLYQKTGTPKDLTVVLPIAIGDGFGLSGLDHLAYEGMIKRLIGGSYVVGGRAHPSKINQMVFDNKVEAYNLPQGVLMHLMRDIAAKKPGVITKVGLGSFVDPRFSGGKLNEVTTKELVRVLELDGEEWLYYKSFPIDVAIIRATTADEDGNLSMEKEAAYLGVLHQAMAVHNSGGIVIAQVERVAKRGTLPLHNVKVPGILVDVIVEAPNQQQCSMTAYDPSLSGEIRVPIEQTVEIQPMSAKKLIASRAIAEFKPGMTINVGYGTADLIPSITVEKGLNTEIQFLIEQGTIGGTPVPGGRFGVMWNPAAMLASPDMFDLLDGGAFDLTCLASAEVDQNGSVTVHRLPGMLPGCGGFLNIIENVKQIIFCGTFTAGGLKTTATEGRLQINQEGSVKKFVAQIEEPTFNAMRAIQKGQNVMYITERAVFRLTPDGLQLTELAPGVDLEKDVLRNMAFKPLIQEIKTMDSSLFIHS